MTFDRRLPLKDKLAKKIHDYILKFREQYVSAGKPDFLFVTHKDCPTKGFPLSKSGYRKIMSLISLVSPSLYSSTGHQLRHIWNEKFSELMD